MRAQSNTSREVRRVAAGAPRAPPRGPWVGVSAVRACARKQELSCLCAIGSSRFSGSVISSLRSADRSAGQEYGVCMQSGQSELSNSISRGTFQFFPVERRACLTARYTNLAQACKSVHLACFTLICDAQQLYTDAAIHRRSARTAPVLSASRPVAKTARSAASSMCTGIALSQTKPVHRHARSTLSKA